MGLESKSVWRMLQSRFLLKSGTCCIQNCFPQDVSGVTFDEVSSIRTLSKRLAVSWKAQSWKRWSISELETGQIRTAWNSSESLMLQNFHLRCEMMFEIIASKIFQGFRSSCSSTSQCWGPWEKWMFLKSCDFDSSILHWMTFKQQSKISTSQPLSQSNVTLTNIEHDCDPRHLLSFAYSKCKFTRYLCSE